MQGAWMWITRGYIKAWENQGYEVLSYNCFSDIPKGEEYHIMARDWDLRTDIGLKAISKAKKAYFFAQPNVYPLPWGSHPNFMCTVPDEYIQLINQMDHVHLWTFGDDTSAHTKWKAVNTVPLAFDSIRYVPDLKNQNNKYDICFVGGWANNGFNEKKPIMIKYFNEFMNSGLRCGFFINKGLSHEQEVSVIYNSKITLNIHDAYQRVLGHDTNERTFKSLGLNGLLISDKVTQLERIFPGVKTTMEPTNMVKLAKQYLSLTEAELNNIKQQNIQNVLDNHCYTHRVQQFISM